jgi:hypothetical protein
MRPYPASSAGVVMLLFIATVAAPAGGAIHTWSGPASPCGSTLQACINGATPDDIVRVATNTPIQEDLDIQKSLTLEAALGFSPVIGDLHRVLLSNTGSQANRIVFRDFTLTRGWVLAFQTSTGLFDVTIHNLTIANTFNGRSLITVGMGFPGSFGPIQFAITHNDLTIPPDSQDGPVTAISIEAVYVPWLVGIIQRNRIDHFDGGQGYGIGIHNGTADLDVDAIANEIRGSDYNVGIGFFTQGPGGTSEVRFLDNLVVGQVSESGAPGAYVIDLSDGSTTFEVVNNTAADSENGILIDGRDDLGAAWSGVVANNIVAGMSNVGISIEQPTQTTGTVTNDHNLVFDVDQNHFSPGPGTVFADPLFVGGGNYRLTDPSPARNAGDNRRVPLDLTTDLDGNPRIFATTVDMGAYESMSTTAAPAPVPERMRLHPNAPDPFGVSTTLRYDLPRPGVVSLGVFDVQGRPVRWLERGAWRDAGRHQATWDGRDRNGVLVPAGVYLVGLETGDFTATERMVRIR